MDTLLTSFKLSKSEFLNGNNVLYFCINPRKTLNLITLFFIIILSIANIYFGITSNDNIALLVGIILLLLPFFIIILHNWKNNRFYKSSKVCSEEISYIFNKEKISRNSESYSGEYKVSSLNKVIKTKNWIFLFLNTGQINLLPKRNFSENDLIFLKEIFDENKVKNNL